MAPRKTNETPADAVRTIPVRVAVTVNVNPDAWDVAAPELPDNGKLAEALAAAGMTETDAAAAVEMITTKAAGKTADLAAVRERVRKSVGTLLAEGLVNADPAARVELARRRERKTAGN